MATELGPGTFLDDRFRLEDLLDEFSGARVWRATDQTLARNVAVHVMDGGDARAGALLTAARASATVPDGHLLRVLDAAAVDGVVYVVQEWASGVSLDRLLAEGTLAPRRAAWVAMEAAEAVSVAHRHGIAHGRLVPENVLVTDTGAVKLAGLAIDAVMRGGPSASDLEHSAAEHADVVNLGALLYAGLVGRWPGTPVSAVPPAPREHGRALRPRRVRAGVPRVLDVLCDRVLNSPPPGDGAPVQTAYEVYAALADFVGEPGGPIIEQPAEPARDAPPSEPDEGGEPTRQPTADATDPEATRAGAPLFYDAGSGVGWVTAPQERGIGGSGADVPAAPPLPDLPEPEPRPLFAPEPAERPPQARAEDDPAPAPAGDETGESAATDRRAPRARRNWLIVAAAVATAAVIAVGIVVASNFDRGAAPRPPQATARPTEESPSPVAAHRLLSISSVTDFDPEGDPPTEHPGQAALAIDGDPSTAWQTLTYKRSPELGNLKSGVGLLVDLGSSHRLSKVQLTLVGSPTSLQILAAPGAVSAPASASQMQVVGRAQSAGQHVTVALTHTVTTRWFAVWLTSLPPVASNMYRGQIAEIAARS